MPQPIAPYNARVILASWGFRVHPPPHTVYVTFVNAMQY